jgi:hypothetical protein
MTRNDINYEIDTNKYFRADVAATSEIAYQLYKINETLQEILKELKDG